MADEKQGSIGVARIGDRGAAAPSRRDFYMAHIAAAELGRHAPDASLYLPDIVGRAAQLATLLMKKADENG